MSCNSYPLTFIASWPSDSSAGIIGGSSRTTVTLDREWDEDAVAHWKQAIADYWDAHEVRTEAEQQAFVKAEGEALERYFREG